MVWKLCVFVLICFAFSPCRCVMSGVRVFFFSCFVDFLSRSFVFFSGFRIFFVFVHFIRSFSFFVFGSFFFSALVEKMPAPWVELYSMEVSFVPKWLC